MTKLKKTDIIQDSLNKIKSKDKQHKQYEKVLCSALETIQKQQQNISKRLKDLSCTLSSEPNDCWSVTSLKENQIGEPCFFGYGQTIEEALDNAQKDCKEWEKTKQISKNKENQKNKENNKENIVPIERNLPHVVSEVICLKCLYRWIAVRPENTLLKALECPECSLVGFVIETGEKIEE